MAFKQGDHGSELRPFQEWLSREVPSYTGVRADGYYGNDEVRAVAEAQRRYGLPVTGMADDAFLDRAGYQPSRGAVRMSGTWVYTAAGTSGQWWMGPQFDVGEAARVAGKNHQPLAYPAGGFLGLMGGDPNISYDESIFSLKMEWARLLRVNTSGDIVVSGYSQSADGFKRAILELFGTGGEFAAHRHRLRRVICFGDPTRQPGPTKIGNNPPGSGIARLDTPAWLDDITYSITTHFDLYACTTDDTVVALFYPWFVKAETSLTFVGYSAQIVIPAIASYIGIVGPLLGGVLGAGGAAILAATTGIALPLMTQLITTFASAPPPDRQLVEALSAQGVLDDIPRLIRTLVALGGIQAHGEYHLPKPEFGGRTGIEVGIQLVNEVT